MFLGLSGVHFVKVCSAFIVSAIGRAGIKKKVGIFRPVILGSVGAQHRTRQCTQDDDTHNEDDSSFAGLSNLTNMSCSVLS